MVRLLLALLLLLPCVGCLDEETCAQGPMTEGAQGLRVTAAEHGAAWGEADCWGCHVQPLLHRSGCTPDVDLGEVRAEVAQSGLAGCAACHGDNGVRP